MTLTDVSTTCAVVIFRVKVSWYYTLVIDLIGQLCRDVISRNSVTGVNVIGMVTSTITLLNTIYWDSTTCITYSTDYYQRLTLESWITNIEQTPLNRSQQLPAP